MNNSIIFEQPLNERVRTFLRLEHLFDIVNHHITQTSDWDHRIVITNLLNITDLLSRSDIKSELIKELERHSSTLNSLQSNPNVDHDRLSSILDNINGYLVGLRGSSCQPGQLLRQNELITSIKQRSTIPGGSCNFDLPGYHHWLNKPVEERTEDLNRWKNDLLIICDSLKFSLLMIRNSTSPVRERAESGFYQKIIESNLSCHLIRIVLPDESKYFPEISGGKHRFTVRFMEQGKTEERPIQTNDTVEFEFHCCIL
ncbi:MAG: cell division protein ZapD [Gammaproteobacteria bacterium]